MYGRWTSLPAQETWPIGSRRLKSWVRPSPPPAAISAGICGPSPSCRDRVRPPEPPEQRAYATAAEGAASWWRLLDGDRYAGVLELADQGQPYDAAWLMGERGYYTAPKTHYASNVQRYVDAEGHARNEGDIQVNPGGPYPISYEAIVPKASQCTNLLVPVCLSSSHIAYGSIRMEPVFMVLGQSAATAAALAIDGPTDVQEVDYSMLRGRLLADGQVLSLP